MVRVENFLNRQREAAMPPPSAKLSADISNSVVEAARLYGVVRVAAVAEEVRRRHVDQNIALEDIERMVLHNAQESGLPCALDGLTIVVDSVQTIEPQEIAGEILVQRSTGIASPEQLQVLTTILDEYCSAADIEPGTQAYMEMGQRIMALFNKGVATTEDLAAALCGKGVGRDRLADALATGKPSSRASA